MIPLHVNGSRTFDAFQGQCGAMKLKGKAVPPGSFLTKFSLSPCTPPGPVHLQRRKVEGQGRAPGIFLTAFSLSPCTAPLQGRCICGAVEFEAVLTGDLAPAFATFCHCNNCRRATSSSVAHIVGVPRTAFHVTQVRRRSVEVSALPLLM